MHEADWKGVLGDAFEQAVAYLEGLPERPLGPPADIGDLRAALGGPLPQEPGDPRGVIVELARRADAGIMASGSARYHGFVVGGTTPAALAADWLASAWDQNAGLYVMGPAAAVVEEVTGAWLADLLGLPPHVSVGFVTGAQMATFTGLAVGLSVVLRRAGWDLAAGGLQGAPPVRVFVGEGRHGTVDRAVRFLGLGTGSIVPVGSDDQGRMLPAALEHALQGDDQGPTLVCAQAGDVNSGSVDPLGAVCDVAHRHGAWVHVDGAFGLWAAASPRLRPLVAGVERADSWATDAHKWLNVPYDSGLVFCADPQAHRQTMGTRAGYLMTMDGDGRSGRDGLDFGPEHSRRARGFAVYAALRASGRSGVAELVEHCCAMARRFADRLGAAEGFEVLNDVVLNQVLVRRTGVPDPDAATRLLVERVQAEGTTWMSGTTWRGGAAMRISVSNWATDADDVDRAVTAIMGCART